MPGYVAWNHTLVVASIVFAVAFGAVTMHFAKRSNHAFATPVSVLAMVLAICIMHFTAMGAATLVPDPRIEVPSGAFSREVLAALVLATSAALTGVTLYVMDSRSQRDMMKKLRHAALHDPLTGLPNRTFLEEILPTLLKRSEAVSNKVAVIVIDLDHFKEINDVHA